VLLKCNARQVFFSGLWKHYIPVVWVAPWLVLGVEGDIAWTDIKGNVTLHLHFGL
jgi:hypothetical protein